MSGHHSQLLMRTLLKWRITRWKCFLFVPCLSCGTTKDITWTLSLPSLCTGHARAEVNEQGQRLMGNHDSNNREGKSLDHCHHQDSWTLTPSLSPSLDTFFASTPIYSRKCAKVESERRETSPCVFFSYLKRNKNSQKLLLDFHWARTRSHTPPYNSHSQKAVQSLRLA